MGNSKSKAVTKDEQVEKGGKDVDKVDTENELVNDYILRKCRRYMSMLDTCYYGVLRERDFVNLGKRTYQIADLKWTKEAEDLHKEIFHTYFTPDREECTFDDWMNNLRGFYEQVGCSRKAITDASAEVNKKWFAVIDSNNDQKIHLKEYTAHLAALGVPPQEAIECFKLFDEDNNGYLDLKEFGVAYAMYFYDPYPSKYSNIFGKFHDMDSFDFGDIPIPEHLQLKDVE